jgi:hypothetical protein
MGWGFFWDMLETDVIMTSPLRIIVPLLILGGWIYFRFFA